MLFNVFFWYCIDICFIWYHDPHTLRVDATTVLYCTAYSKVDPHSSATRVDECNPHSYLPPKVTMVTGGAIALSLPKEVSVYVFS